MAIADREAIMVYVAQDNSSAAIDLDIELETKARNTWLRPTRFPRRARL
jgi:plasmid stabilization system protein ParE